MTNPQPRKAETQEGINNPDWNPKQPDVDGLSLKIIFTDCKERDPSIPEEARWLASLPRLAIVVVAATKDACFNEVVKSIAAKAAHDSGYKAASQPAQGDAVRWVKASDKPLFHYEEREGKKWWVMNDDAPDEFIGAVEVEVKNNKTGKTYWWWKRHCIIEEGRGLCVVTDDDTEPAGWEMDDIEYYIPFPSNPSRESTATPSVSTPASSALRDALSGLVMLKDYKDKYGKDEYYEKHQPLVWEAARAALSSEPGGEEVAFAVWCSEQGWSKAYKEDWWGCPFSTNTDVLTTSDLYKLFKSQQ